MRCSHAHALALAAELTAALEGVESKGCHADITPDRDLQEQLEDAAQQLADARQQLADAGEARDALQQQVVRLQGLAQEAVAERDEAFTQLGAWHCMTLHDSAPLPCTCPPLAHQPTAMHYTHRRSKGAFCRAARGSW
jgi:chromosome segregation ATPase